MMRHGRCGGVALRLCITAAVAILAVAAGGRDRQWWAVAERGVQVPRRRTTAATVLAVNAATCGRRNAYATRSGGRCPACLLLPVEPDATRHPHSPVVVGTVRTVRVSSGLSGRCPARLGGVWFVRTCPDATPPVWVVSGQCLLNVRILGEKQEACIRAV